MKEFSGNQWTAEIERLRKMEATVKALVEKVQGEWNGNAEPFHLLISLINGLKLALHGGNPPAKFNVCYNEHGHKCLEEVCDEPMA